MKTQTFQKKLRLPVSVEESFDWHTRPGAFERLTPPWEPVRVVDRQGTIQDGDTTTLNIKMGPLNFSWIAEHHDYRLNEQFCDKQIKGPFAFWDHSHLFESVGSASQLIDRIDYALPGGAIGRCLGDRRVQKKLERVFAYRHRVFQHDLAAHQNIRKKNAMHVAITGTSGLIGAAVAAFLTTGGHRVTSLVRRKPINNSELEWDSKKGVIDSAKLEGIDAIIHLAGESIADGRWNDKKKQRIRESRIDATQNLVASLSNLKQPPEAFICASAIGIYGDRGDEKLDEHADEGEGFLANLVHDWEAAAMGAETIGSRVVLARFGVVLSPKGGALKTMLTPFRFGMGGPVGSGKQYMSWVSLNDAAGAIHHALMHDEIKGPMNVVSPNAVTNKAFGKALGKTLRRPAFMPLPGFAARLLFGEMADELLLSGAHVVPRKLASTGYTFRDPELAEALRWMLGKMTQSEMTNTPS